jgi:hypothetical protein
LLGSLRLALERREDDMAWRSLQLSQTKLMQVMAVEFSQADIFWRRLNLRGGRSS